jgi:hypothetical protein
MKSNKNLSSSLLLSLLCVNSCLFAPVSYAAELDLADLQEEISNTTLVSRLKVKGVFLRGALVASHTSAHDVVDNSKGADTNTANSIDTASVSKVSEGLEQAAPAAVSKDPVVDASPFPGSFSASAGYFFYQPIQKLNIGGAFDFDLFQPTSLIETSRKNSVSLKLIGLLDFNDQLGLQVEAGGGAAIAPIKDKLFNALSPFIGGSAHITYKLTGKWMFSVGLGYDTNVAVTSTNTNVQLNEGAAKISFKAAYMFDSERMEEVIVK